MRAVPVSALEHYIVIFMRFKECNNTAGKTRMSRKENHFIYGAKRPRDKQSTFMCCVTRERIGSQLACGFHSKSEKGAKCHSYTKKSAFVESKRYVHLNWNSQCWEWLLDEQDDVSLNNCWHAQNEKLNVCSRWMVRTIF